jgi:hypothetical protein
MFRFGPESQFLVARAYNLSRDRPELDGPSFMGDCYNRTHGMGCLRSHPRVQASHAMSYCSKFTLSQSLCNDDRATSYTAHHSRA